MVVRRVSSVLLAGLALWAVAAATAVTRASDTPPMRASSARDSAAAAQTTSYLRAVYHPDPTHLWNRLHDALFVRIGSDGLPYGRDRVEPLLWRGTKHLLQGPGHDALIARLQEFLDQRAEKLIADPLAKALLQRDLLLVFNWLESLHDGFGGFGQTPEVWQAARRRLRQPLAAAIGRLALTPGQVHALRDNYAAAVSSGQFAARFDPYTPDRAYLPPELFNPNGPWVSLGREQDLIAPMHVTQDTPFTNSVFLVFIRLPNGRAATLDYVERLRTFKEKASFRPAAPTREHSFGQIPNQNVPKFPVGTEVALVRRALLVTWRSSPMLVVSPLTEQVQVRVYREIPEFTKEVMMDGMRTDEPIMRRLATWQATYEFVLSRPALLAGRSGGLRAIHRDERDFMTGFSTHGVDVLERHEPSGPLAPVRKMNLGVVMDGCGLCHSFPGIYSFNTFVPYRFIGFAHDEMPRTPALSPMPVPAVLAAGLKWKERRPDWATLRELLASR